MATIHGIINKGIINSEIQFEKLGYIASNFSNWSTDGYKAVRFEQILDENGYMKGVARTDFSQGAIRNTSKELDVAIDGTGFIPVTSETGEVAYTREGSLKINKDGYITTNDGYLVGDGIQLPVNYGHVAIKPNGDVEIYSDDGTKRENMGNIPLVNFLNPEGLKKADNNKYYLTVESGEPVLDKKHTKFKQGSLEATNIDLFNETNNAIRLNASMLASFKLMQTVNDLYSNVLQMNQ